MWLAIFLPIRTSTFSLSSTDNFQKKDFTNRKKLETYLNNLKTDTNEKTLAPKGKKMTGYTVFGSAYDSLIRFNTEKTGRSFQFFKYFR